MGYNPTCTTDSRVFVNGTRIPAGDVDIHERKEGPLDINRYAEFEFASPFRGEDYLGVFGATQPSEQERYDTVYIDLYSEALERYVPTFRGLVTGLGNSASNVSQHWHGRAQSVEMLLSNVPASFTYEEASVEKVLQDVVGELQTKVPIDLSVEGSEDLVAEESRLGDIALSPLIIVPRVIATVADLVLATPKTFKANKHTLADVLSWLSDKVQSRFWFQPTEDGVTLVGTDEPTQQSHQAHYLGGSVGVIENNALSELRPVNTLILNSKAANSLASVSSFELNAPSDTFTQVKARHRPLYERAGEVELHGDTYVSSDSESKEEAVKEARSLLKRQIDQTTGGSMDCYLAANVAPFDTITARPTCREQPLPSMEPLTYEVSRVHHKVRASETSKTELNVGVHAAMDDIEIIDSWQKNA